MGEKFASPSYAKIAFKELHTPLKRAYLGGSFPIKRRSLLIGTAGTFIASTVRAALPSDDLDVVVDSDEFTIIYAGRTWRLRHATLGVDTRVYHRTRANGRWPNHEIRVENAAWPGTGQDASFVLNLSRRDGGVWNLNFRWRAASSAFNVPFLNWLDGRITAQAITQDALTIRFGTRGSIALRKGAQWTLTPDWKWRIEDPNGPLLTELVVSGEALAFDSLLVATIPGNAPEVADYVGAAPPRFLTRLRLAFTTREEITIVRWNARDGTRASLALTNPERSPIDIYAGIFSTNRRAFVRMDGPSVLRIGSTSPFARRILLDRAVVAGEVGLLPIQVGVAARVRRKAQIVWLDPGTVTVIGDDEFPINFNLDGTPFDLRIKTNLIAATFPIDGADLAEMAFASAPLDFIIGDRSSMQFPNPAFPPSDEGTKGVVRFSAETTANLRTVLETLLPLTPANLRVLRARDLMDLRFRFRHMSLAVQGRSATLVAHRSKDDGENPADRSLLIVEFSGQSKLEQAFSKNPPFLPQAYMAGPARLVFDLNLPANDRLLPFNAHELTRWARYSMVVIDRALPADAKIDTQLKTAGITPTTSRDRALQAIKDSLKPPSLLETQIELPAGLLLSPSKNARWITSSAPADNTNRPMSDGIFELWSASIDRRGPKPDLRFVWTRTVEQFRRNFDRSVPEPLQPDPFGILNSLNEQFRLDLVLLTSVYGLPALRRLKEDGTDDANGQVLPIPPNYSYIDAESAKQEGIYIPRPIAKEINLSLTSLSALALLSGTWVPPQPYKNTNGNPTWCSATKPIDECGGISLQQLTFRQILEGGIYVRLSEKGYLFPVGHPCSRLQITERQFWDRPDPPSGEKRGRGSTGYDAMRTLLVVDQPDKTFPALNQPSHGRRLPARLLSLLTQSTPMLIDPFDEPVRGGMMLQEGTATPNRDAYAFWPRITKTGSTETVDVIWEYLIDGDPNPVRSPLLFVNNGAATSSAQVAGLVKAYNETVDQNITVPRQAVGITYPAVEQNLRRATLGGKLRRYAESDLPNQTSFETTEWHLAAEGRNLPDPSAAFTMDAYMNGQDQPPFYPLLEKAQIRVQSIERLSGEPNVSVWVRPADVYVENGFANNDLEIFLHVLDQITFDLARDTSSGGGLANPKIEVGYLTKQGPISAAVAQAARLSPAARARPITARSDVNLAVRPDATLLGMIRLVDLLPAGYKPKIVETAVTAVDNLVPVLRDAVNVLMQIADHALQSLQNSVAPGAPTFATLYPGLASKLETLRGSLGTLRDALGQEGELPANRLAAIDRASTVHSNITGLLDEVNAIARNPVPALASELVEEMSAALETIRNVVNSAPTAIRQWVETQVRTQLASALDDLYRLHELAGGEEALRLLVGAGELKDIEGGLRWLIGLEAEAFKQKIEAAAGAAIDELKGNACRQFASTTEGAAILHELLGPSGAATACDDPDGLTKALAGAANQKIAERVEKIKQTLFYDVFGVYLVSVAERARTAIDSLIKAAREGEGQLTEAIFKLLRDTLLFAIQSGQLADIAAEIDKVVNLCDLALTAVQSLARDTMAPMTDVQAVVVTQVEPALDLALNEAGKLPSPLRERATSRIGDVRLGLNDLSGVLKNLNSEWEKLPSAADVCQNVDAKLSVVRSVIALRGDALQSAAIVLERLSSAVDVLSLPAIRIQSGFTALAIDNAKVCRDAIGRVGEGLIALVRLISTVDPFANASTPALQKLKDLGAELQKHTGNINNAGTQLLHAIADAESSAKSISNDFTNKISAWQDAIKNGARDPRTLRLLVSDLMTFAVENDLHVAGLIARAVRFDRAVHEQIEKISTQLGLAVVSAGLKLYDVALTAVNTLVLLLESGSSTASYLRLLLKQDVLQILVQFPGKLQDERGRFAALQVGLQNPSPDVRAKTRQDAVVFFDSWIDSEVAQAARAFSQLSELLLRGHFDAVFDLTPLKNALEAQLSHFIPTTARVSYEVKTDLRKLDGYGFKIDESVDDQAENDLELCSTIEVDLLSGDRRVASKGHLKPTIITLFPAEPLLTVHLGAIEFRAAEGSGLTVDQVDINKVELDGRLKYLNPITSLLSEGGESGPYYIIDLVERFIKVGYRIPPTNLIVGTFAVLNASLDIAVILRLQDKPATLAMKVGTRQAPVTVVATLYGGAMFLGLEAGAKGFTAVEICIEAVAMAALSFPPLSGWARVAAGLYFAKTLEKATFSGFVQAAGEGNLACFSIAALLEVGMTSENGTVKGSSFYSFSFKVGFVELSYGFTAEYNLSSSESSEFMSTAKGKSSVIHRTRAKVPRRDTEWREYKRGYAFLADELL